jgi:hypothetical protein
VERRGGEALVNRTETPCLKRTGLLKHFFTLDRYGFRGSFLNTTGMFRSDLTLR